MMKKVMMSLLLLATATLGACQASHQSDQPKQEQKEPQAKKKGRLFLSNMNSAKSQQEIRAALSHQLKEANVNAFMAGVQEYKSLVGKTGKTGAWKKKKKKEEE